MKIKENSWIAKLAVRKLKAKSVALTLGRTIHLYGVMQEDFLSDKRWICHELVHVNQYRYYGFLPFLGMYLWESLRRGYFNNKWEIEAKEKENDFTILEKVILETEGKI